MSGVLCQSKRTTVFKRDGGFCHYCDRQFLLFQGTPDHVVPKSRGGRDANWNLVWSCRPCNQKKDDALPSCMCSLCSTALARWADGDRRTGRTSRGAGDGHEPFTQSLAEVLADLGPQAAPASSGGDVGA